MNNDTADLDAGWIQGGLLTAAVCLLTLSLSVTLPIIPAMLRAFAGEPGIDLLVPLAVTAPMLTVALIGPLAGALGERVGRRTLLNAAALVFAVAAVAPYVLTDFRLLVASRALAGVALGAMIASAVGLTGDYYSGSTRQRWLSVQGAAGSATAVIAASAAGVLAQTDWRLPFLLLGIGFPYFAALLIFRGPTPGGRTDAPLDGIADPSAEPTPWRSLYGAFSLAVLAGLTIFPPSYAIGLLLEDKALGSVLLTGVITSALAAGAVGGAVIVARLRALRRPLQQACAFAVAAIGAAAMWGSSDLPLFVAGVVVVGVGQGMTTPALFDWVLSETPPRLRGRAVGLFQTTFFLAQFAAPLLGQAVAVALHSTTRSILVYAVVSAVLATVITVPYLFRRWARLATWNP